MGVRILVDDRQDSAVLYCSTTDWAFGPVVTSEHGKDAEERLSAFVRWHTNDLRTLDDSELHDAYHKWREQEVDQYAKERLATLLRDQEDECLLDGEAEEILALQVKYPEVKS